MTTTVNTVVVGGGQAGLSVSHYLTEQSIGHLVLEQGGQAGDAWRNHRWDSFTLNTPRWQSRLPGVCYGEDDPDGFMPKQEIVSHLDDLARRLPLHTRARVVAVERDGKRGDYLVRIAGGENITAHNVVMATGLYQTPKIPHLGRDFPPTIKQLHSDGYRNPEQLLPGAVLVVGSAQSGAQIAEELYESGRKVYLAVGRAGRTPRRYRGKDANWWLAKLGAYERTVSELPSPRAKFSGKPHISGTRGGHTLNLHQFARDGVTLLGRLEGVQDGVVRLAGDLHENLAAADRAEAEFVRSVDLYVARSGLTAPQETMAVLRDGFAQDILTELDLEAAGISNVIWATGYAFDFSLVKLPVVDGDGFPIQTRGISAFPGLFFVGLPWLHTAKSGLIYGVGEDARYIADRIAAREGRGTLPAKAGVPAQRDPAKQARFMRQSIDRLMTLIWSSALSLALDGFATYATGMHQPARDASHQEDQTSAPADATTSPVASSVSGTRGRNLTKTLLLAVTTATGIIFSMGAGQAFPETQTPLPPHVAFVTTPASRLSLGMTAEDVTRIVGPAVQETNLVAGAMEVSQWEFSGAIPIRVTISGGRITRLTLDAFRVDKGDLPSFSRRAWPGMASQAVRRVLGEPSMVHHHTLFGIDIDQWIFSRPGGPDVSVFFRNDRVIAKLVGRDLPTDLFQIALPSPPPAAGEGPMRTVRAGMTSREVEELLGAPRFRTDYVFNGEPAVRAIYGTRDGRFTGFNFVDDVVIELEDLGWIDEAIFQGG